MTRSTTDVQAAFRLLPAIDEVMRDPEVVALSERLGRDLVQSIAVKTVDTWRAEIRAGKLSTSDVEQRLRRGEQRRRRDR